MLLRELAIDTQTPSQGPVGRSVVQGIEVVGPGLDIRLTVGEPGLDQIGALRVIAMAISRRASSG